MFRFRLQVDVFEVECRTYGTTAVGHPGAGAAIGGGLGLGAGALVGDQLQGHEITNHQQQQQINRNQTEINRNRQDIERLRRQNEY